jgi:hypothetical protein
MLRRHIVQRKKEAHMVLIAVMFLVGTVGLMVLSAIEE